MTQPESPALDLGYQVVQLAVTDALISALDDWSDPVQVRIVREPASATGWEMRTRTVNLEDLRTRRDE
jgi:hypothetical protein